MVEYKSQANKPVMQAHAGSGIIKNTRNWTLGYAQAKNAVVARMAPLAP